MKNNQKLSILVWLFKAKATKDGRAPIYARVTIDGRSEEIALGRKALPEYWDAENKSVTEGGIEAKITNQKIVQAKTELDRLLMVLQTVIRKVITSNPLEAFVCSAGDKEVMPLELPEVEAIYRKPLSIARIAEVRDADIFQCFTGLIYQDINNLSPDDIVEVGKKRERWLIKDRGKTEVTAMIPLLPIGDELIEKYKDHP